jgi:hypothetical protein
MIRAALLHEQTDQAISRIISRLLVSLTLNKSPRSQSRRWWALQAHSVVTKTFSWSWQWQASSQTSAGRLRLSPWPKLESAYHALVLARVHTHMPMNFPPFRVRYTRRGVPCWGDHWSRKSSQMLYDLSLWPWPKFESANSVGFTPYYDHVFQLRGLRAKPGAQANQKILLKKSKFYNLTITKWRLLLRPPGDVT